MQAVRRQLPPPEGPCQPSPSGQSRQPSPRQASHTAHSKAPANTTPGKQCIAPEQYVAADEIFKVRKPSKIAETLDCLMTCKISITQQQLYLVAEALTARSACACCMVKRSMIMTPKRALPALQKRYASRCAEHVSSCVVNDASLV